MTFGLARKRRPERKLEQHARIGQLHERVAQRLDTQREVGGRVARLEPRHQRADDVEAADLSQRADGRVAQLLVAQQIDQRVDAAGIADLA